LSPRRAGAVLKLDVTQGTIQPVPIAIPDFVGVGLQDPAGGRNVSQIITSNLQRSGLFAPIDPAAYIEKISTIDTLPRFANWRRISHIISDAIYERITGEKGYFDSRVVFVDESGPKERRIKRLALMDQ